LVGGNDSWTEREMWRKAEKRRDGRDGRERDQDARRAVRFLYS
jgi:hypothetical protein